MDTDEFQAVLQRTLNEAFEEKLESFSEKLDQVFEDKFDRFFEDKLKIRDGASVDLPKVERQVKSLVSNIRRTNLPCDIDAEDDHTAEEVVIVEPEPEEDDGKNTLPEGWMEHIDPTYFDG